MEVQRMSFEAPRVFPDEHYPFCKPFQQGVMLGVEPGLYIFTRADMIRQTGFPDARESWGVVTGIHAFNEFIETAVKLGNFEITNTWAPSVLALSYVIEALNVHGSKLHAILESEALSSFISAVFPAVKFAPAEVEKAFTQNGLPSPNYSHYDYKMDLVRCSLENWGMLRFAERHVGFQYEVDEKTQTTEIRLFGTPHLESDETGETLSLRDWMTYMWKRLYFVVLWKCRILTDDFTFHRRRDVSFDEFKYRPPMGVMPTTRCGSTSDIEDELDERLCYYE